MLQSLKNIFKKESLPCAVVIITLAFGTGILSYKLFDSSPRGTQKDCLSDLFFVNPEPDCELYEKKLESMSTLQDNLEDLTKKYLAEKKANRIAVFSRDLKTRRFVGVNDTDVFVMASLLKVPLAIAYFRLSEITSDIFSQEIKHTNANTLENSSSQRIKPREDLVLGNMYTVRELIYRMLAYSDNASAQMLSTNFVSPDYLNKVLLALGLQVTKAGETENILTAKTYAGIFRTLYNASFLSRDSSNKVLDILSQSTFADGATALLPKNVKVAHKFGERIIVDEKETIIIQQLHDCGIVYAKNGDEPYTFCILTEGKKYEDLKYVIQNLSKAIFDEMSK